MTRNILSSLLSSANKILQASDSGLLGQDDFLRDGVITRCTTTEFPPKQIDCCICMEKLEASTEHIVFLAPCKQFFHGQCITSWFTSTRPERDTCPVCRLQLFKAKNLTKEQIAEGQHDEEEVVPDGNSTPSTLSPGHRWMHTVRELWDSLEEEAGRRRLRVIFRPHKDTLVLITVALALVVCIVEKGRQLINTGSFSSLEAWINRLAEDLTDEKYEELHRELSRRGLFESGGRVIHPVPVEYVLRMNGVRVQVESLRDWLLREQCRLTSRCK
ncbi:hypothetical protein BCR34DRAFT_638113 [Clohesyomyces aquaticus]|uniref:RING-type domain-containing protein n=1 Tax=Clohesyomyces aquaticus TaxID=1231657 RepID=A0A1Y1YS90_9PLEO|nr:hypothetical protein BCR34DRAFT_638113 [Clohesyomyces aquaticus]